MVNFNGNSYVFPACYTNVHKRCQRNVANNCGINTKQLAEMLTRMGVSSQKLTQRRKKVPSLPPPPTGRLVMEAQAVNACRRGRIR